GASSCSFGPTCEMPAWDDFVAPATDDQKDQPSYLLFRGQMICLNIVNHKGNQTTGH
ncbi:unnamed protein product, partial [Musa acuminata var. zebrina]